MQAGRRCGPCDHFGPLLKVLFENTRALFGDSPDALFSQAQTIIGPIIRNIEVTWAAEPPRAGVLTIRPQGAPAPLSIAIWEGNFESFFEMCGVQGTVEKAQLSEENRAALIRVHWWSGARLVPLLGSSFRAGITRRHDPRLSAVSVGFS